MNFNVEHLTQAFGINGFRDGWSFPSIRNSICRFCITFKSIPAKIRRPFHGKFHSQTIMA